MMMYCSVISFCATTNTTDNKLDNNTSSNRLKERILYSLDKGNSLVFVQHKGIPWYLDCIIYLVNFICNYTFILTLCTYLLLTYYNHCIFPKCLPY